MKLDSENKYLEYKAAKNSLPKDFWETYSSFANTEGGYIILGVTDDLKIQGVQNTTKVIKELFTMLNNPKKVNRNIISDKEVTIEEIDGKKIIRIFVPEADINHKPIYINENPKQSWIRDFETDRKTTAEELKTMIRNSQDDLDSDLLDGFDISDLDEDSLSEYKILLSKSDNRYQSMDNLNMLIEIGAFKRDRKITDNVVYKLTFGGLLFFGKFTSITGAQGLQHFHLDYFNYINSKDRWRDRVAPGEPGYPNINIFNFYRIVLNKLTATIDYEFELDENLERTTYIRDIGVALREALANSLIHADYFSEHCVKIESFNSYYSFFNPGKMKISIEEFISGGTPKPRNYTITNLFRKVGISERAGSGGPEIFRSAQEHRLNFPNVYLEQNSTLIQIWKVDVADANPNLADNEKAILKLLIKKMLPLTSREIKSELALSKYYFDKAIKNLVSSNFIEQNGQGKATKYALKTGTREYLASLQKMVNLLQRHHIRKQ